MPARMVSCISLPPATIKSVPIDDFAKANEGLAIEAPEQYFSCCGKSICSGCLYSCNTSGNSNGKCPFCNSDRDKERCGKTDEEEVEEIRKRVEANDAAAMYMLALLYHYGLKCFQQDLTKAVKLYTRSGELGNRKAHKNLGGIYHRGGNLMKAKFHWEAAAMAGDELARYFLGTMEYESGNMERAIKHLTIAASAGCFTAMHNLRFFYEQGWVSRESINSTLAAYNNSCADMRSEARDAYLRSNVNGIINA
jgi:TPR repeat protein